LDNDTVQVFYNIDIGGRDILGFSLALLPPISDQDYSFKSLGLALMFYYYFTGNIETSKSNFVTQSCVKLDLLKFGFVHF